jgi:BirA family biotin operon repressor/biotin-[acetyl-CoA-carboxylase] ligase
LIQPTTTPPPSCGAARPKKALQSSPRNRRTAAGVSATSGAPEITAAQVPAVTAIGVLAVVEAVREEFRLDALVRWPNDAVINDKKFSGVLARAERFGKPGQRFILGIGLNVNLESRQLPADFAASATSLMTELGAPVSRERVARALLVHLDRWYKNLKLGRFDEIEHRLQRYSSLPGRTVTLESRGKQYTGTVIGLSLFEGIQLRLSDYSTGFFPEALTTLISK